MDDSEVHTKMTGALASSTVMGKLSIIAVIPTLLLLDTAAAVLRGAAVGRLDLAVVIASTLVLSFFALAIATRSGRAFLQAHSDTLAYISASGLIAWLVAEIIVSGFVFYISGVNPFTATPPFHTRPPRQNLIFAPNEAYLPVIFGVSHYTTNSMGLRGSEFPAGETSYRILTIGGSTTECAYLDDRETWQHLLMNRLNQQQGRRQVWIGSAGISGYPTVNHVKFVAESPLMDDVDALLFLIGANDFNQFLRGNLRDGVFEKEGRINVQPVWHYSPILQMVRDRWQRRQSSMEAEDAVGNNIPRRRLWRQTSRIRESVEGLDDALRQYESRVETLVTLTRSHGLRPVFLTQPTLWDKNLSTKGRELLSWGDISESEYLSVEAGREGIDRHNDVLLRVCERMGVECVSTASMHGQEQFYYDDFHFNEAGAAELARIVGDYLLARAPVDDWETGFENGRR